jgi:V/A-type H+/Na+-transporting ATPase subunit D
MARLPLNKSSLKSESDKLKTYERFLPSLDLKRKQLMAERKQAGQDLQEIIQERERLRSRIARLLPLLGTTELNLSGLVAVERVDFGEENVLGVKLPVLAEATFRVMSYSTLSHPFWVDPLVDFLEAAARLEIRRQVQQRRVELLEEAVRKITQRVNLFEKVLIPRTRQNIKQITIYLSDAERAAVVRAKIAKAKRQRAAAVEA